MARVPVSATTPETSEQLRRKASRGSVWAVAGFGGGQAIRLLRNMILARLVTPELFGLMGIVNAAIICIGQFTDIGVGPSVVQSHRSDRSFVRTAWTLQVLRGFALTAITMILAFPIAYSVQSQGLTTEKRWLLAMALLLVAFNGIAQGFQSIRFHTASRKLAISRLTLTEMGGQFGGLVITVGWALVDPSLWALAAGAVGSTICKTALTYLIIPGEKDGFAWNKPALRELLDFGKWVFVSTILGYLAAEGDKLLFGFGALASLEQFGIYTIAILVAGVPQRAIRQLTRIINFPYLSRTFRDGGKFALVFRNSRRRLLLLSGWMLSGFIAGGPIAIDLLYDERYLAAGWMLQLLTVGVWFNVLAATTEAALLAAGDSKAVALTNAAKLFGMAVLMPVGWAHFGLAGAIAGFSGAEIFRYAYAVWRGHRLALGGFAQEAFFTAVLALASFGAWMMVADLQWHVALEALVVLGGVSVIWSPIAWRLFRRERGPLILQDPPESST